MAEGASVPQGAVLMCHREQSLCVRGSSPGVP